MLPPRAEKVAALKESLAANQAALKSYTWTETTEISMKGEVKKKEQKLCRYGADGKSRDADRRPAAPKQEQSGGGGGRRGGGRMKEHVVEKKVGEIKDYMGQVAALVKEYVPPDKDKIQAAQTAGNVSMKPDPSAGTALFAVKDYLKPGDSLAIGLNMAAKALSSYDVTSYVEDPKDDQVTLSVTFDRLPDGVSYPRQTVLDVKAKQIKVVTTNSGYAKTHSRVADCGFGVMAITAPCRLAWPARTARPGRTSPSARATASSVPRTSRLRLRGWRCRHAAGLR